MATSIIGPIPGANLLPHSGVAYSETMTQTFEYVEHTVYHFLRPTRFAVKCDPERPRFNYRYSGGENEGLQLAGDVDTKLYNRLQIFHYLSGPFWQRLAPGGPDPSVEACDELRKVLERLLQLPDVDEGAEIDAILQLACRYLWVLDQPTVDFCNCTGDLMLYQLRGMTAHRLPINLWHILRDGEDMPNNFYHRLRERISDESLLVVVPHDEDDMETANKEEVAAFIAQIDALMEEENEEPPAEGAIPRAAPTR